MSSLQSSIRSNALKTGCAVRFMSDSKMGEILQLADNLFGLVKKDIVYPDNILDTEIP